MNTRHTNNEPLNRFSTVDIWLAYFSDGDELISYLSDNYDEFGDDSPSRFRTEFGIASIDEDLVESAARSSPVAIEALLGVFSDGKSYSQAAAAAARSAGFQEAYCAILCFDLRAQIVVKESASAYYLGQFSIVP